MPVIQKLWIAIFLFGCIACNKDKFKPDYTNGKATATRNGEHWEGQGRGIVNNLDIGLNMYYDVFNNSGELRQRLAFSKIPKTPGVIPLFITSSQSEDSISGIRFSTLSHDGDVVEDIYRVVEIYEESNLTVISYDESTRLFTGKFKATLYIDPAQGKRNPDNPDTLMFEVGEFEVRIEE